MSCCGITQKESNTVSDEIPSYYRGRKEALLKDFDRTADLMKAPLAQRLGAQTATEMIRDVRREYETLIPEIPYLKGLRARTFNNFLLITAQELAVYKALQKRDKSACDAWELCHEALRRRLAAIPRWKRWLMKCLMFSPIVKAVMRRRAEKQVKARFGEFEVEYLIGDGREFDFGVNYLQCGNVNFVKKHGGEAFVPYICMSDIALSEALGWGLTRTQTLADGCPNCNFRFKKGNETRITSQTFEVQKTIEMIAEKEAREAGAVN